jgi:hypothetical protein
MKIFLNLYNEKSIVYHLQCIYKYPICKYINEISDFKDIFFFIKNCCYLFLVVKINTYQKFKNINFLKFLTIFYK